MTNDEKQICIESGQKARELTRAAAIKGGVTEDKVMLRIHQALNAKQTKFFSNAGFLSETPKRPDHKTRLEAAKFAAQLLDMLPSQKVEHDVGSTLAVTIKLVNERRNGSGPISDE